MKKRRSTVLQNAWSQKSKHSHWKNNSGIKNPINSYEKNGTAPSYKMPEAKKTNTLIEKTIPVLKTLKIHMRKRHSTVLQNAWSKKTNTLIEKTILLVKTLSFHMKKRHSTVLQNASSQKKQTLSLKKIRS